MGNLRKVLGKLNPKNDAVFMGYALQFRQSIWMSGGELMSGSSHIRIVLIGIKYRNCCRTLGVYLLFAILLGYIESKLNYRSVTYKLASP